MKKLKGTIKIQETETPPVIAKPKLPKKKIPVIKTPTVSFILSNIKNEDNKMVLSEDEVENLASLKFSNGELILTVEDRQFLYEISYLISVSGYQITYNFLNSGWDKVFGYSNLRKKIIFENPLLIKSKEKLILDMDIYRNKVEVSKGAVDCKRCGSSETLATESQHRSADEATTVKVVCLACDYRWTAQ